MTVQRSDITKALDEMIGHEEGTEVTQSQFGCAGRSLSSSSHSGSMNLRSLGVRSVPLEAFASTAARMARTLATATCFSAYNVDYHCSRPGN